jgi:O-antigen/teichoic acid export membrane protein
MTTSIYSKIIVKGALISFFGMFLGRGLTYLYVALVARLGSFEYGLLSLGLAVTLFLSTLSLVGLNSSIVRYISFYRGKNDNNRIKGTILSSIKISLPASIIFMVLLFIFSEQVALIFFHNTKLVPILRLFSLTIPFIVLSNVFLNVILGYQKIEYQIGIKEISENIIKLVLTFLLIYSGYKLFGAALAYVIAVIMTTLLSLYFIQKKVFPILNKKIKSKLLTKELLKFSFPLLLAGCFALIMKWADVFMIGFFRTPSEVGVYNVALPTASLLALVPTGLIALFLPVITNLYTKKNKKEIKTITIRTSKWTFFVNFPIFIILLVFAGPVLKIMFGQEYVVGSTALSILLFAYLIHSLSHVNSSLLIMLKKTKIIFLIGGLMALSNLILNLLLIPRYGIIGGAIASSFSLIIGYVLHAIFVYKFTKIFAINLLYFKFIIAGFLPTIVLYFLKAKIEITLFNLIILSLIFAFVYFIFAIFLKSFDEEDKNLLKDIKNKIIARN